MSQSFILKFSEIRLSDLSRVGGKNASLGELFSALKPKGVGVLDGFAITTDAYWRLLEEHGLKGKLEQILPKLDPENLEQLAAAGHAARTAILETPLPDDLRLPVSSAYKDLMRRVGREVELAVRSSASAEDLPEASFAGAAETFLNIRGEDALLRAVHQCFASLFTDRAISYRARQGFGQLKVALSVGVMPMVRSDLASSGVIFTLDTESGFRDVVTVTGSYGLGEFIVQGVVTPDEWMVFKPTLRKNFEPILSRQAGSKEVRLVYAKGTRTTQSEATPQLEREQFCLNDADVIQLRTITRRSPVNRSQWISNGPRMERPVSYSSFRPGPRRCTPPNRPRGVPRSISCAGNRPSLSSSDKLSAKRSLPARRM
jgi:pyruvate,water dikinase